MRELMKGIEPLLFLISGSLYQPAQTDNPQKANGIK
jgi:hypothetical protein